MATSFRRMCLPYVIERNAEGRYAVLNRRYVDVGTDKHDAGGERRTFRRIRGLGPKTLDKIAHRASGLLEDGTQRWWLYDDGCLPDVSADAWSAYSKRLWQLRALRLFTVE